MVTPPRAADIQLEAYRGTKWLLEREYGDLGLLQLHRAFQGNLALANDFLGFTRRATGLRTKWRQLGMPSLGHENNIHNTNFSPVFTGEIPAEELLAEYRAYSLRMDTAYSYRFELQANGTHAKLVCLSDLHFCNRDCDVDRLMTLVDWIRARRNVWWVGLGDFFDLKTKTSVGNREEQLYTVSQGLDMLELVLRPIRERCVGCISGNHDNRIRRDQEVDWSPLQALSKRLDLQFWPDIHKHLLLQVREQQYTAYLHHGKGASRTPGAKLNSLEQIMDTTTAELVLTGHLHDEILRKRLRRAIKLDNGEIIIVNQRGIVCPSFLKPGGYAEDKALPPSPLGCITVELYANEHQIRVVE